VRKARGEEALPNQILLTYLMTKHYAQTAAPAFGKADADDFHVARKVAQKNVRGGMKAERPRD
jgi:hypothetical protein